MFPVTLEEIYQTYYLRDLKLKKTPIKFIKLILKTSLNILFDKAGKFR